MTPLPSPLRSRHHTWKLPNVTRDGGGFCREHFPALMQCDGQTAKNWVPVSHHSSDRGAFGEESELGCADGISNCVAQGCARADNTSLRGVRRRDSKEPDDPSTAISRIQSRNEARADCGEGVAADVRKHEHFRPTLFLWVWKRQAWLTD